MATETGKQPGKIIRNQEAVTMSKVADLLEPLSVEGRLRVLCWVNAVYGEPKPKDEEP